MSWRDARLVAFDVETTGVDYEVERIVTAAVTVIDDDRNARAFTWLLNPGVEIPAGAAEVHGITTEHARANGMDAATAINEVVELLSREVQAGAALVAFNAPFDLTILDREARRHGLRPLVDCDAPLMVIDPFVIDKHCDRFRRGKRTLSVMCAHYGVVLDEAHAAGADALAAARLAWRMGRRIPDLASLSLPELHELQVGWAAEQATSLEDYFRRQGRDETCERAWPMVAPPTEAVAA